jgi:hypothetical protein
MNLDFFNEMLEIIKPDLDNGPWIAGGYPMRIYSGMELITSDIDVFFKDQQQLESHQKFFNDYCHPLVSCFDFSEKPPEIKTRFNKFSTTNADTYTDEHGNKIQLIFNVFHKDLNSIFDHFDINLCKIATDGKIFIANESTYHDIENKILNFSKIQSSSLKRFTKYVKYGFKPSKETIEAIYESRSKLSYDFSNDIDY